MALKYISDLGMRPTKSGIGKPRRWSVYECEHCGARVERDHDHGRRMKSCGCKWADARTTHGLSTGGTKHPIYKVWDGMKARCFNTKAVNYGLYGGRGITICKEWMHDAGAFVKWAQENGWAPGLEIDRRDNNGNYTPENCRFVTRQINAQNRRDVKLNNAVPAMVHVLLKAGFKQSDLFLFANSNMTRCTLTLISQGKIWKNSGSNANAPASD